MGWSTVLFFLFLKVIGNNVVDTKLRVSLKISPFSSILNLVTHCNGSEKLINLIAAILNEGYTMNLKLYDGILNDGFEVFKYLYFYFADNPLSLFLNAEASFITRAANEWYTEPFGTNACSSFADTSRTV